MWDKVIHTWSHWLREITDLVENRHQLMAECQALGVSSTLMKASWTNGGI